MKYLQRTIIFFLIVFTVMTASPGLAEQSLPGLSTPAEKTIRIGVLAHKGIKICNEMWQPTMAYLDKTLPGRHFVLVPLKFRDIKPAVQNVSIDFLICNPAIYVNLEVKYGITRTLTLRNRVGTQVVSEFGGVIFCKAGRNDLHQLQDVRGQRLAAVRQTSLGGWLMALREFKAAGVNPERDCARLFFLNSHPAVVRAVLSGEADIGTVRTDTLERMAASGEIRMDEIRVIPAATASVSTSAFPCLCSTRLYPEWPFAKLSDTPNELSQDVSVALLNMPADSPSALAAQSGGWSICLNYTSVHDCLRELRMPPYEHYGQMSWLDMWLQYWPWIGAIAVLIITLLGALMLLRSRQLAMTRISSQNRLLLASAGEGICGVDMNGIVTFVNPAAGNILGFTAEELIGGNLHDLTHPVKADGQPYPENECPVCMVCNDGTIHQGDDEFFYRKDGSIFPISYSSRPVIDNGKIVGAVICFQNITQRKQAEELLRESEARLRALTDSAQDAIIMMNPDGRISFWNPAAERILGYKNAEAVGKKLDAFIMPSRYHEAYRAAYSGFQQTGQGAAIGKTLDLEAIRKDGMEISIQLSLSAVHMGNGWHAVGILRDTTERKQAETELQRINIILEEATIHANDMAVQSEAANAAKSEFLAHMSHEIRTPMNGIIGMIGLLLDTELNDEQRRYAEIVNASGESLLSLINDILDFSKIEAKRLDLEILDFDLSSLLDDFASTLAVRSFEKGLELICSADLDVPTRLRGDPGRLRQILTNLTGNAIKFTHEGEVIVHVSLLEESEDNVLLRFSVSDTGIGIPENKIGLLFNKFSQVDSSVTRQYGGTGLGLAISKQLAELMGGHIGVNSEEGKGSEFWFTARLAKQVEKIASIPSADLIGVRVLVVDDNATNREILVIRLAFWGMRPAEAKSGPGALQALEKALDENDPFRIAVIDMQMPGMDGETLGRRIQADDRLKDIRMVMLTSLGIRGDASHFQKIGFAAYVTKPIRNQELKTVLSMALSGQDRPSQRVIATRHTARESLPFFENSKARILLADDNITNQQVALGILKKLGLRADAVANGAEVLNALESLPYDLILMDVQMPVMDGMEATRRIREKEKGKSDQAARRCESQAVNFHIPIIAMTAHAMQGDREQCLAAGMNDYVSKPVSPQALTDCLKKWLPIDNSADEWMEKAHDLEKSREAKVAESPVWDRSEMLELLMDDEDLVKTITESFLSDIPGQIQALKAFLQAGDVSGVERQAHTIKGASANVGGERLRAVAFEIEKAARAQNLTAAGAHMADLEMQFDCLKEAMKR
jgi:PAS domain S-box-containing protein